MEEIIYNFDILTKIILRSLAETEGWTEGGLDGLLLDEVHQALHLCQPRLLLVLHGLLQRLLPLNRLLLLHLIVVELREVVDDDGDGERHDEHTGDGAAGAHEHAGPRLRADVSVAHRGHGDDRPPEAGWDGGEARVRVLLAEVAER